MNQIRTGQAYLYRKNGYKNTVIEVLMKDEIERESLQKAIDKASQRFFYLTDQLLEQNGVYYLAYNPIPLRIAHTKQLRSLGSIETGYHLIDITYTKNQIKVSFHHALCDGRGIKPFVETLLYYYCSFYYQQIFSTEGIRTENTPFDSFETVEPFGTNFFQADVDNTALQSIPHSGFSLPENEQNTSECFRTEILVSEKEFLALAKKHNASPAILTAILFSGAIYKLHPDTETPIVCSMATDLRHITGTDLTHRNCTGSIYLPYTKEQDDDTLKNISNAYRNWISIQKNEESVKKLLNQQIGLFNRVDSLNSLEEKKSFLSFFDTLLIDTYVISYLGQMQFNDFNKYIESVHLYSGQACGMTLNMIAAGGKISFNILQSFEQNPYIKPFLQSMSDLGLTYETKIHEKVLAPEDQSHITASSHAQNHEKIVL